MLSKSFDFSHSAFDLFYFLREESNVFFLDSSLSQGGNGRYSFIGFAPFLVSQGNTIEAYANFKKEYAQFSGPREEGVSPLCSGAVGYLSYDFGLILQGIPSQKSMADEDPFFHFGFYDVILTIDHLDKKLHVISSGLPELNPSTRHLRSQHRLKQVCERLDNFFTGIKYQAHPSPSFLEGTFDFQSSRTKEQYVDDVCRALEHIRQGDIYEINLSHKITTQKPPHLKSISPWQVYARLRDLSPSHFSAFYDAGSHQIMSSSPERFLSLRNGAAQIRPMKGTRPRGQNMDEDQRLKNELLNSEKEIAELLMVTDLERNDLGRVCEFGSVQVKALRTIEEYKTVFQATSTIEGKLRQDRNCFDLIEACFPSGSVTGCPKISAMKIIDEIETCRRGIYTGAFGYLDFSGDLDFNVLIRTLVLNQNQVSFHVGGGIVADSDPLMEYDETWVKAQAMILCLSELAGRER